MPFTSSAAPISSSTAPPTYRRSRSSSARKSPTPSSWNALCAPATRAAARSSGGAPPTGRGAGRAGCRRVERRREQRNARIHLNREPDREQREAEIADPPRREPVVAVRHQPAPARSERANAAPRAPPAMPPAMLDAEVDDARVARRQEHLQRLQRKRQRHAGGDGHREPAQGRAASRHQRDEKAERRIGDDVGGDVEAGPARRPRREQEERRVRRRRDPRRERLQARVDDRDAVERREIMRQQRAWRVAGHGARRAGRQPAGTRRLRMTVTLSCSESASKPASRNSDGGPW